MAFLNAPHRDFWVAAGPERLRASLIGPADQADILSLHGAGPSSRERIYYLADYLATNHGLTTLCFDHSGHGESSGSMVASSLPKRTLEALAMRPFLVADKPLTLIGTSMGGHLALECLPHLNVSHLVLFCPALYGDTARYLERFDAHFSHAIRAAGSFENASVLANLNAFNGKVLTLIGAADDIIPPRVMALYAENAAPGAYTAQVIPQAPHQVHGWLLKNPPVQQTVLAAVTAFLKTTA